MSDPLRDYKIGQFLEAATVNALTQHVKSSRPRPTDPASNVPKSSTVVMIRHDGASSEDDVERYGVLGIDGVVIERNDNEEHFDNCILLSGVTPEAASSSTTGHAGKFGIAQHPIAVGQIGRVVISGASQAWIDVVDEDHEFADVKDGDVTQLESSASGAARILYKPSGTGTKLAIVNIGAGGAGGASVVAVKLTSNIDGGVYGGEIGIGDVTYTSGDLTMPQGMTFPGSEDAIIFNLAENGLNTNILTDNSYHFGLVVGDDGAGKRYVLINFDVIGKGDFVYQVLQMGDNGTTRIWDYVRAHA